MAEVIKPDLAVRRGGGVVWRTDGQMYSVCSGAVERGWGCGGVLPRERYLMGIISVQVLWISRPLGIHRKRLMAERAGGHSQVWGDHTGSRVCNHEL